MVTTGAIVETTTPTNYVLVFFPTILVKSSIEILASGHRLLNLQEITDLPSEKASLLSLSLSLVSVPHRKRRTISRCGSCP